jgi:HSP20 family protein
LLAYSIITFDILLERHDGSFVENKVDNNYYEDDGSYVLKAELPGIKKEEIDITLTGDNITISGEKKNVQEIKKKDYYRGKCSYGTFSRTFSLPGDVQTNKVISKFTDGVLEIRMPKSEEAKKEEVKLNIQ